MSDKLIKKAINKIKAKKYLDAEALLKKILRTSKHHLDANYLLGTIYAEQAKLTESLKYLLTAEQINPASPYVHNNLGNVYRMQQQYDQAIKHYQRALSLNPSMTEACNNLAICLKQTGAIDEAIEFYQRAVSLNPSFVDAWYNLGNLYWDNEDMQQALPCYERVLQTDPSHARSHDKLGTYYLNKGENEKALLHFNRYLELAEEDECGVNMKLAYLEQQAVPDSIPEQLVRETYEKKSNTWDQDVKRKGMEFLGPGHIKTAFETYYDNTSGLHILDLGCGTGLCGEFLHTHAASLTGVDLSEPMLARAKEKNYYDDLINGEIVQYLRQCNKTFDLVTASGVIIFLGDLQPLLQSIQRCLKDNGRFIFTLYKSAGKDIEVRHNIHFAHSPQYMQNSAVKCGFLLESMTDIVHEFEHDVEQAGLLLVLKKVTDTADNQGQ